MKNLIPLILLLFIGCKSTKTFVKPINSDFSKLIFKTYSETTKEGDQNSRKFLDSFAVKIREKCGNDSLANELLSSNFISSFINNSPNKTISLEIKNDTIWKTSAFDGSYRKSIAQYDKRSGIVNIYYRNSNTKIKESYNALEADGTLESFINLNDRKTILGFDCYKIIIKCTNKELNNKIGIGDTVYEMYVTDEIKIPLHSMIKINKLISDYFPLEIILYSANLKGNNDIYKLVEIHK